MLQISLFSEALLSSTDTLTVEQTETEFVLEW